MRSVLTRYRELALGCAALVLFPGVANAAPVIYTDEALYIADLAALGITAIHESFEDDNVWADSRNSISIPGSTPAVTSQGVVWTSNYQTNRIATGTVGGSAPDGSFALYSLPHGMATDSGLYCDSAEDPNIPIECYLNDGVAIAAQPGDVLFAFGGRIDTANSGKVTFLLDGVDINGNDTDNIDNWQREGDSADNWAFVGVIDPDGFFAAELRELRGKDFQQVFLFSDDFTIGKSTPVQLASCNDGIDNDGDGAVDYPVDFGCFAPTSMKEDPQCQDGLNNDNQIGTDFDGGQSILGIGSGDPNGPDPQCSSFWDDLEAPNPPTSCGLGPELVLLTPLLMLAHGQRRRRGRR